MTTKVPRNTLALAIAAACGTAAAQDGSAPKGAAMPEPIRIEVTGSRLAHIDGETALPVQIIRRDEIERGNWTTAAELLSYVSANFGGGNNAISASLFDPATVGLSSANLRGLGDRNTLVLLNGRRLSNYAFAAATVDLSKIPLAAVDRVEILKDGASSIYGSDAIAGVINFITRKNFAGLDATGQAAFTEHGGAEHYQATVTAGWGDLTRDRFNVFVTLDWQKDTVLIASERSFAATGYRPDDGVANVSAVTFPANIRIGPGNFRNPTAATGCAPPASLAIPGLSGCRYDEPQQIDLLPAQEQWNAIARATWEWSTGQQLFAEFVYSRNQLELGQSPTPASRNTTTNGARVIYPAGGPYYPADFANADGLSGPLEVYFRTTEIGRRIATVDTDGERFVLGGQGAVSGWDYNAAYLRSINAAEYGYSSGYLSSPGFLSAMGTGLVNPFGASGQAGLALLSGAQAIGTVRDAKGTLDLFDASFRRDVIRLPAGPLSVAIGGEWRREHLTDEPSALTNQEVIGVVLATAPAEGSRTADAVFAEVNVPLLRGLELGASLRYDHYSDFGGTTNPKIAVRWQPVSSLLLRGTAGTGFLAPTLPNLYTPQTGVSVDSPFQDPVRCPVTGPGSPDCQLSFLFVQGGNPNLRPATSTQFSAGAVWDPVPGMSLGAQWWRIDVEDVVNNYFPFDIFRFYDALAPGHIVRGPPDPAYPGLPGPIVAVLGLYENVGNLSTSGIDVTIGARYADPATGTFRFSLNGTYVLNWLFSSPVTPKADLAGTGGFIAIPRWRHYAEIAWQRGSWGASIAQLFQSGYSDLSFNLPPRDVGTYGLWNAQGVYSGFRDWSIAAGIRNLFDTAPPFSNQARTAQVGYDPWYADPRGRSFYLRLSYAFR